jgi:cathepsin L
MKNVLALILFVAWAHGLDFDKEWDLFKDIHGKVYQNKAEELYRRRVWQSHVLYIQEHNQAYSRGEHSYYLGENEYADMSNQEFQQIMNGYKGRTSPGSHLVYQADDVTDLPPTVDWRDKGYVTPIKNQGSCGSCWAFSSTGSLEGQTFKKYGRLTSLSEQNLVDCSQKQGNQGCSGGLMDQAFAYIKANGGIDTEISYPYEGVDAKCRFNAANVGANDTGFVDVQSKDEAALQSAVATIGPVSVAIDANHLTFQLYKGGVYHNILCSETRLDHGVLAVGYGTYEGKDFWQVKNSWGTTWGMQGYIMMSRNRNNNCGIATQASYPIV